jgi:Cys-tRNA(Pro)/Cys-tRNA(Cys) deacylase
VGGTAAPALAALIKTVVPHKIFQSGDIAPEQVLKTLVIALPHELAVAVAPVPPSGRSSLPAC